jgi:hypothetical protein
VLCGEDSGNRVEETFGAGDRDRTAEIQPEKVGVDFIYINLQRLKRHESGRKWNHRNSSSGGKRGVSPVLMRNGIPPHQAH